MTETENLSRVQRLTKKLSSEEKFEAIKQESMQWHFICQSCNNKTNLWEIGAIRYKAKGEPRVKAKCPKCNKSAIQKLIKADS